MLQERIQRGQALLVEHGLDAFIVEKQTDIAYFLHDQATTGLLLIERERSTFFVHRMDRDKYAHIQGVHLVFCDAGITERLLSYVHATGYQTIGFDAQHTPYATFCSREQGGGCTWVPLSLWVERLRSEKSEEEIQKMQQAAALGSEGYDFVLSVLQEGISEKEVARLLRIFWAEAGAEGPSFPPIIAFGAHAAFPHAVPTERKLKRGDIVLIDIGVLWCGYCSDMTRTVAWGEPASILVESYPAVVEAQQAAMQRCQEGAVCVEIYEEAVRVLRRHGLDGYFCHGLGHGVGRDIHEYPTLSPAGKNIILKSGMTVTIEPGVYFPGVGGIRIEDTILIQGKEVFNLTNKRVPPDLICL